MLATQCQFCRHDNAPGSRFCAECGSPLHLKPCPKCGKVDDVTVKACYACGTPFPPIATAPGGGAEDKASTGRPEVEKLGENTSRETAATGGAAKPRAPAWPLILVAALAGGLPLLWMNRAHLPLPQAWRIGEPGAAANRVETRTLKAPLAVPPPAGSAAQPAESQPATLSAPPPAVAVPAAEQPPGAVAPPAEPPAEQPAAATEPPQAEGSSAQTEKPPETQDVAPPAPSPAAPAKRKAAPTAASARPPARTTAARSEAAPKPRPPATQRECTEAVAALGLCDPRQAAK